MARVVTLFFGLMMSLTVLASASPGKDLASCKSGAIVDNQDYDSLLLELDKYHNSVTVTISRKPPGGTWWYIWRTYLLEKSETQNQVIYYSASINRGSFNLVIDKASLADGTHAAQMSAVGGAIANKIEESLNCELF